MTIATTAEKFRKISRDELKMKIDSGKPFTLWNVLTKEYYHSDKNIPGSIWVPVNELEQRLPSLNAKKTDEIVVYCGSTQCPSSRQAAQKLASLGYTNVSAFEGGVADWQEADLPFVTLQ